MHITQSWCWAAYYKALLARTMNDFSPVSGGAVEKGSQTTPGISAGREPTLSLVLKRCGWELPFLDVVSSKQSDTEQRRSLQLTPVPELGTQVVVRLVTAGAAVTGISVFLCVCVLPVSPLHSIAVHADACSSTKRGVPRHKQYPPPPFILHMAFTMTPPAGMEGRRDMRTETEEKEERSRKLN